MQSQRENNELGERPDERDNDNGCAGATALGGALWGLAAHGFGVVPRFLGAAGFALLLMVLVHVVPALRISIDFTASVTFEPAPLELLSQNLAPNRLPAPETAQ